jgi:hypothetical protein
MVFFTSLQPRHAIPDIGVTPNIAQGPGRLPSPTPDHCCKCDPAQGSKKPHPGEAKWGFNARTGMIRTGA